MRHGDRVRVSRCLGVVLAGLGITACGGSVGASQKGTDASVDAREDGAETIDAGNGTEGSPVADAASDFDVADSSEVGASPPACAAFSDGGNPPRCAGVDQLVLSMPVVQTADGGAPGPGDSAILQVLLSDPPNGPSVTDYPAVCFASDTPGVTVGSNDPAAGLFAINPGMSGTYAIDATFASSLPPGTVVHFAAQTTVLSGGCGNGSQLRWDYTLP